MNIVEGIEEVKKYYPNIDDDTFMKIIELDPTYKKGSTSLGTYGKWLLNLFKSGKLKDEDFYKVTDYLSLFNSRKSQMTNRDINQFKSLGDLAKALDELEDVELSHRQEVRKNQKARKNANLDSEADLVFENSNWEVYVPKTYVASCKLGQGTEWCTATTESDDYYNQYTKEGKLYVNINKNTGDKYQFHIESGSYMDAYDRKIDIINFFNENKDLYKFYKNVILDVIKNNYSEISIEGDTIKCSSNDIIEFVIDLSNYSYGAKIDSSIIYGILVKNESTYCEDWKSYFKQKDLTKIEINDTLQYLIDEFNKHSNTSFENIVKIFNNNLKNNKFITQSKVSAQNNFNDTALDGYAILEESYETATSFASRDDVLKRVKTYFENKAKSKGFDLSFNYTIEDEDIYSNDLGSIEYDIEVSIPIDRAIVMFLKENDIDTTFMRMIGTICCSKFDLDLNEDEEVPFNEDIFYKTLTHKLSDLLDIDLESDEDVDYDDYDDTFEMKSYLDKLLNR